MAGSILQELHSYDLDFGGLGQISDTIDEEGTAGAYRVRLYHRLTGKLIKQVWSHADGTYTFDHIAEESEGYFVVGFDHGATPVQAAVGDLITPEPM